jgi:hypothetical protein
MTEEKNYPGRKFKKPSDGMLKYYADLFLRNQNKWIRKSMIKPEQLGSKFVHDGVEYELVGSVSPKEFLIRDASDDFFLVLTSIVDPYLLPKE